MKSRYFHNASTGGFKVCVSIRGIVQSMFTTIQEASGTVMELYDDDPDHFEFFLKYMYTGIYDKDAISKLADGDAVKRATIPIGINVVADKYDVPDIRKTITQDVKELFKACSSEAALAVVHAFYEDRVTTNTDIGQVISSAILNGHPQLSVIRDNAFTDLLEAQPKFAVDVALQLHERYSALASWRWYDCDVCGHEGEYHLLDRNCVACGNDLR